MVTAHSILLALSFCAAAHVGGVYGSLRGVGDHALGLNARAPRPSLPYVPAISARDAKPSLPYVPAISARAETSTATPESADPSSCDTECGPFKSIADSCASSNATDASTLGCECNNAAFNAFIACGTCNTAAFEAYSGGLKGVVEGAAKECEAAGLPISVDTTKLPSSSSSSNAGNAGPGLPADITAIGATGEHPSATIKEGETIEPTGTGTAGKTDNSSATRHGITWLALALVAITASIAL